MSGNIVKSKIKREIISQDWGNTTKLVEEESYSTYEHSINIDSQAHFEINKQAYFIVVSGSGEFEFGSKKKKVFKGEKVIIPAHTLGLNIKNIGTIPLILIEVDLTNL